MHNCGSRQILVSLLVCVVELQYKSYDAFSFTKTRSRYGYGEFRSKIIQQSRTFSTIIHKKDGTLFYGRLVLSSNLNNNIEDGDDAIVDTVVEPEKNPLEKKDIAPGPVNIQNALSDAIRIIAALSLEDYKWRSAMFKNNEADRKMEVSLARMSGEEPFYLRPMHATEDKLGPLGTAEKQAVEWLAKVIEEEGIRATKIAEGDGKFVRPMDAGEGDDNENDGPLSQLERNAVNFFKRIVDSETERAINGKIRPMQLDESKRGPLGDAEARAVNALQLLKEAEVIRGKQQQARGGDVVRPIDVPGPLGEFERAALEIWEAEQQRVKDKDDRGLLLVRPKDASIEGPLGKAEREATEVIERLKEEEKERAKSIRRLMEKKRPMDNDRESTLGLMEALTVGLIRGPKLVMSVYERVVELILSEELELDDEYDDDNIDST